MNLETVKPKNKIRLKYTDRNRNTWTPQQEAKLRNRIEDMMDKFGYVDMSSVAYHCNHSMTSCEWKARTLSIPFSTKTIKVPCEKTKTIKADMRTLPLMDGKLVKYEDVEDTYGT